MKLTYDLRNNTAYLHFHEKTGAVETIRIRDELNVEVASDGTVCGIEFLKATEQLGGKEHGKLEIVNEANGAKREFPLSLASILTGQASPLWQLRTRGNPLTEQQELAIRLCEEDELTDKEIGSRLGVAPGLVRKFYATAKEIRKDYAKNGINAFWLLPTRVRLGLQKDRFNPRSRIFRSRSQVKAAIEAGELRWDEKWNRLRYKKTTLHNLGRESWLVLLEWVSDDWGKAGISQRRAEPADKPCQWQTTRR
jgi:uncharacterized protein YuzE